MRQIAFFTIAFLFCTTVIDAQNNTNPVKNPETNDFAPTLTFLSSGWMEGRETGTRGSQMAAGYIVSMMQFVGLQPFGSQLVSQDASDKKQGYFQDFELVRYETEAATLFISNLKPGKHKPIQLLPGSDFELTNCFNSQQAEAPLVFAGYGISAAGKGYDDYKNLDVQGKAVVILKGFPGQGDTVSVAWRKFGNPSDREGTSLEAKLTNARQHGAVAVILVEPIDKPLSSGNHENKKNAKPVYPEVEYFLYGNNDNSSIPCFKTDAYSTAQMLSGTGIDLSVFEKNTARTLTPASGTLKDKMVRFAVTVKTDRIPVRNLLGIIAGKDTTRSVIIGAHYDHLGRRDSLIYYGADDNASGVAGMLALARKWKESGEKPPCNLVFAAWAAEEKGLLGSEYFAQFLEKQPHNMILYINLDMISRSESTDTARRQLSIGTRTPDENLREIARNSNAQLLRQLVLDLWDVTGHSGSDYASFTAKNIPIMTFNAGLHDDYHTPRDVAEKVDLLKMADVLKVVNACLMEFLNQSK